MRGTFVGRIKELLLLNRLYESDESQFIPVYGRRRVGKSELILHFIQDKPAVYYLGKQAPEAFQIREFLEISASVLDNRLLAQVRVDSWKEALTLVVEEFKKHSKKLVLVLDEFQWIVETSTGLPSVIQELWDRHWKDNNCVQLILCGSYLGFMEREVLGSKSPLFGRRTANILLKPFSFREAGEFHPGWSYEDRAKAWFICGGIPYYLKFFKEDRSIDQNIRDNFLDEYAALFREADFLLREELRDLEKYSGVLMAVAESPLTVKEIAHKTGIGERSVPYYLDTLKTLHLIASYAPLETKGEKKRGMRFRLTDNFLRFWFRFVYPHLSLVASLSEERAFANLIAPQLESWFGSGFELLCREALPVLYAEEGVLSSFQIGEYWDTTVQIDVVGTRKDGRVDIGECKWGAIPSKKALEDEIDNKVRKYPNPKAVTVQKRLFVKRWPFQELPQGIKLHTLKDLYDGEL